METATAPTFTPVARTEPRFSQLADGLMIGGIAVGFAGVLASLVMIPMMILMDSAFQAMMPAGFPDFFGGFVAMGWMMIAMVTIFAVVQLVGAIIALTARNRMKHTDASDGVGSGIAGGVVMIVGGSILGGGLALAGALVANRRREP